MADIRPAGTDTTTGQNKLVLSTDVLVVNNVESPGDLLLAGAADAHIEAGSSGVIKIGTDTPDIGIAIGNGFDAPDPGTIWLEPGIGVAANQTITLQGSFAGNTFDGGNVEIRGGPGDTGQSAGDVLINGGGMAVGNAAGEVVIRGGDATTESLPGDGGRIHINAGDAFDGAGGNLTLDGGGGGTSGNGGNVIATAGNADAGIGGQVELIAGNSNTNILASLLE